MNKNKPLMYGIAGIVVVIVIFIVVYFVITKHSAPSSQNSGQTAETVTQINPTEIGMTLTPRSDNHAIILNVSKLSGIASLDYDVSYDAEVTDAEAGGTVTVPRGVQGTIDIKSEPSIKREIELGTCSRNVCKYDKIVSGIKIVVKVSYSNGKIGAVSQTVNLPSGQ